VLKVYSDANDWSEANIAIPNTTDGSVGPSVYVPWSDFTTGNGSGANFSQVGAIELDVNGVDAIDGEVGPITTVGPEVFTENFANIAQANLVLTKTGAPNPVNAGSQLTYTLTTQNNGPSDATGMVLTDTLPAGVQYVSASGAGAGTATVSNGTVTLQLGTLAAGAAPLTTTIVVGVAATTSGTLVNNAEVTATDADPAYATCSTDVSVPVVPQEAPDVSIHKSVLPTTATLGGDLTYTLALKNNSLPDGSSDDTATNVYVTDILPAGTTFVSASEQIGSTVTPLSLLNGKITGSLGSMVAQATATVTIVVQVDSNYAGSSISNTATVQDDPSDGDTTDKMSSVTTPVASAVPSKRWFLV
jgi:uncharacterized repeat protein (TIGR01451 family)